MARQRTIAPGYFRNEDLASCSLLARLLFSGMWCWADREGRLEDRPKRLKAEILPYDEADGEELVAELTERGFLRRYEANGVRVIRIVNFHKYQKPHPREAPSTLPAETEPEPIQAEATPKADPGPTPGEPQDTPSPSRFLASSSSFPSSPSRSLADLKRSARAGGARPVLGSLSSEVVAAVSAGLGHALVPLKSQEEADELEHRIGLFGGGAEEAISYFAATCRKRRKPPEAVKGLLLMLQDLSPPREAPA